MMQLDNGSISNGVEKVQRKEAEGVDPAGLRSERELDRAVAEVRVLKAEGAEALWKLGRKIAEIHGEKLWKLRTETTDKGKLRPKWASFEAFCNAELQMTPKNAFRLADVSREFTVQEVRNFGTRKLDLLLQAPPESRAELKQKLEQGATHRELEKVVTRVRDEKGYTRETRNPRTAKATETAHEKAEEAKEVRSKAGAKTLTVATLIGNKTIRLYKRPASLRNFSTIDWKTLDRAKRISEEPLGRLELSNGVTQFFSVGQTPGGELILKIATQRVDEE